MRSIFLIIIYLLIPFYISSQEKEINHSESDFSKKWNGFQKQNLGFLFIGEYIQ